MVEDGLRLRGFLHENGYNMKTLHDERGLNERASRQFGTLQYLLDQTEEQNVFNTLARWFAIGVPVSSDVAEKLLPAWVIQLCEQTGLLARRSEMLEPTVMLSPMDPLMIAADRVLKWEEDPSDLVLWPNPTTQQLFNFTVRQPNKATLDLGTGSGIQALAAAEHSESVVATDLNPRAAEFTVFNAWLNGIDRVECVTGDAFEPVQGRRFDLIVANPPFFITPLNELMYCENPMELDFFCRRLAREAPAYLNEGGFYQMVCEWVELKGQPWRERVGEWLANTGCDAWLIKQYSMTPSNYGSERARQRPCKNPAEEYAGFADWVSYYHDKDVTAIHGGLIAMRRRSGTNWVRIQDSPVSLQDPIGDLILNGFAGWDLLRSITDQQLLDTKPKLVPEARLSEHFRQADGAWRPASLKLEIGPPMPRQLQMDPIVAHFIGQFDGTRPLRELVQNLAKEVNIEVERVGQESLAITRKMLEEGFLAV
jgi:hypothetical protein